ncbi:MAG: hypothetical protein MI975_15885, partial [Cytophagales bacterium]|nr:hypothetical protein [Cytophagales bacterium]
MNIYRVLLLILTSTMFCFCKTNEVEQIGINLEEMLDKSAITQSVHSNSIQNSVFIGNGDINGMLFSEGFDLIINLSKNDVWDARLITQNDPPLMKIDIANQKYQGGAKEHDTPPSWKNPYPCPRICGKLIIKGIAPFNSKLDIRKAHGAINNNEIDVRVLAQKNVMLIHSEKNVDLKAAFIEYLPKAKSGSEENIQWITQDLPADKDWKGMSFSVALACGENKS